MSSPPPAAPQPLPEASRPLQWVFGYGSLIWRPDFPYLARHPASLDGYQRRFWQGSHDHRGIPTAPGRVVTLIEAQNAQTLGIVYGLAVDAYEAVLDELDRREQNGYERAVRPVRLRTSDPHATTTVDALVYIATPANPAFLGAASVDALAAQIAAAHGPSGSNRDYLFALAAALRELAADDPHVFELEARVRELTSGR